MSDTFSIHDVSLYDAIDVTPSADDMRIREAISARRRLIASGDPSDVSRRQIACHLEAVVAEAERILLDPDLRASYDHHVAPVQKSDSYRWVIPAIGSQTSVPLDLVRAIEVGCPSPGPFVPELTPDKVPVLREGESEHGRLGGFAFCSYWAWIGAPPQDTSPMYGNTWAYFTSDRLIYVCPELFGPERTVDWRSNQATLSGVLVDATATVIHKNHRRRLMRGRALGGQLPWEYVSRITLAPCKDGSNTAFMAFDILAGDSAFRLSLSVDVPSLAWARGWIEWCADLALAARAQRFWDVLLPSERRAIECCRSNMQPTILDGGELSYELPATLDGGHALTLV